MILATDVHYSAGHATAAGLLFESWAAPQALHCCISQIHEIKPYRPGHFYERELPCLLELLREHRLHPDIIVVDGYVFLDGISRPGLGKHLFDALGGCVPVVGVAKTAFRGIGAEFQVLRGGSTKPLFVTCVGEGLESARAGVRAMHGRHRLPELLKQVDRLCRDNAPPAAGDT
ncbi:endonuclease V [Azohydromonas caseinilytica]|uniref:Endonuclease V n=1 Tax=Azohydromonas caseinilytica TaxID=2728836 RepID=A0A848FFG4_9BURK|nr:endonuclease V [Azohydromonas caseinilytica]NML16890.1 endonuclease V [Azohydromonas caseinilytica]